MKAHLTKIIVFFAFVVLTVGLVKYLKYRKSYKYPLDQVISHVKSQKFPSVLQTVDFIRIFVNENSLHKIDEEHKKYAANPEIVIGKLFNKFSEKAPPPHLSCGPRARVMKLILDKMKIKNRTVHIFSDEYNSVRSHSFLEVDTGGGWHIQDPDFNIYYENSGTKVRASIMDLVFGRVENYTPCKGSRNCGWKKNHVLHLKNKFFEATKIDFDWQTERQPVMFVNSKRFDRAKIFPGNGNISFNEFAKKHYDLESLSYR